MQYTIEQIEAFKAKAEKWDALDAKILKCYPPETDEDKEYIDPEGEIEWDYNADLVTIGGIAAQAFGYL